MAILTAKPTGTTSGTSTNDLIYGTSSSSTITINGLGGQDTVSYENVPRNIFFDVGQDYNYVYKSTGGVDVLQNVEAVSATNTGGDVISGQQSNHGINVNLQLGSLRVGTKSLTVTRFENVIGSKKNDTITGNGGANWLYGAEGGDIMTGGGGADIFNYENFTDSRGVGIGDKYRPGHTMDIITDFQSWQGDKIDLRCIRNLGLAPRWIGHRASHTWGTTQAGDVGWSNNHLVANFGNGNFLQVEIFNNAIFGQNGQASGSWANLQHTDVLL